MAQLRRCHAAAIPRRVVANASRSSPRPWQRTSTGQGRAGQQFGFFCGVQTGISSDSRTCPNMFKQADAYAGGLHSVQFEGTGRPRRSAETGDLHYQKSSPAGAEPIRRTAPYHRYARKARLFSAPWLLCGNCNPRYRAWVQRCCWRMVCKLRCTRAVHPLYEGGSEVPAIKPDARHLWQLWRRHACCCIQSVTPRKPHK
jgi:hypothetical protein